MSSTPIDFYQYPLFPGFKEGSTSFEAAESIQPSKGTLQRMVMDYLKQMGHHGATPDECASFYRENILNIRPRFSELKEKDRITKTTRTRQNSNGKNVRVWVLAELTN